MRLQQICEVIIRSADDLLLAHGEYSTARMVSVEALLVWNDKNRQIDYAGNILQDKAPVVILG